MNIHLKNKILRESLNLITDSFLNYEGQTDLEYIHELGYQHIIGYDRSERFMLDADPHLNGFDISRYFVEEYIDIYGESPNVATINGEFILEFFLMNQLSYLKMRLEDFQVENNLIGEEVFTIQHKLNEELIRIYEELTELPF